MATHLSATDIVMMPRHKIWRSWSRLSSRFKRKKDQRNQPTNPYISIIIPIYNTESYVEKCVRSAMQQTLKNIEIICVNDASTDSSAKIVEILACEDPRIRLIHHARNRGLGGARNTGIKVSRAPYVTGIDSDDYIEPEMMERLWQGSDEGSVDIVACGFCRVDDEGAPIGSGYSPQQGLFNNDDNQINIFEFLNPSFCNKIWKKTLFTNNNILFPDDLYFEDLAVTPQLMWLANQIRVIDGQYYRYLVRSGSTTNSCSPKHIIDHFKVFDILEDFLIQEGLLNRYGDDFVGRVCRSLSFHASNVLSSSMNEPEKTQYLRFCLMMKMAYLNSKDQLRNATSNVLQDLLNNIQEDYTETSDLSPEKGSSN